MKKILNFKIPLSENTSGLALDCETVVGFLNMVKEQLGDDYYVVATPFDMTITDEVDGIPCDALSIEEFVKKYRKDKKE